MSSQLKRISDIIGSFVSKDYKRKRLEEDSRSEEENSPEKKFKSSFDDFMDNEFVNVTAFMKRVSTFSDFCWCRDIPQLSPLEIARHGWASTNDEFMVKCESCGEYLSLKIPEQSSGFRESWVKTAVSRLFSAHGEFCSWSTTSSPSHLTRVQVPDYKSVIETASSIAKLAEKLPHLKECYVAPWTEVIDVFDKDLANIIQDENERKSSLVLALCGWSNGELEETLTDVYKVRRIGVWNFVSIQDQEDMEETRRVADELGQSLEEDRDYKPEGKEYLDPLSEHMTWHPLLQEEQGSKGWQHVIEQLTEGSSCGKKKSKDKIKDSFGAIYKVRDLLDQW